MSRFWGWLADALRDHAGLVAVLGLLVTLILGAGITRLHFATGQDSYLNPEDRVYQDNVAYQDLFGGDAMLVLLTARPGTTVTDAMSAHNLAQLDQMAAKLQASPELIEAVVTPRTALEWSDNLIQSPDGNPTNSVAGRTLLDALADDPTEAGKALRQADATTTLTRLGAVPPEQRTLDDRAWVDFLIHDNQGGIRKALNVAFTDETHAQMVVRLTGNAPLDSYAAAVERVRAVVDEADLEGVDVTVTGAPVLLMQINNYLQRGMLTLGAIALAVMTLIIVVLFNVRWRLLPLAVVLVGVIWAFGLAGYIGIPLTLVTIAGLPVMLGVGIDFAIQMQARVEEEVVVGRAPDPIKETAQNLCPALLVVTFDAVFAFAAVRFSRVPMIRQFGLLLAIGIAVICFASIILPLASLGIRERRWPTTKHRFKPGRLGSLATWMGHLPKALGPFLAAASVVVFVAGVVVEGKLVLQTDPVEWVDQGSQDIEDYRSVQEQTGSSSEAGYFIHADDVFAQPTVDFVTSFADRQMAEHPADLLTATSLATTVKYLIDLPGAGNVTPRAADVKSAYDVAPRDIQISTVNPSQGAVNLIFRYGTGSLEERRDVLDQIRADTDPPPGVTATPSGLAVVGVGLLENLEANRILLTYLAIAFVGVFLSIRLLSVVRALLSLVPVLIAVGVSSLAAWALQLKLSPMTAVGGPLVVALCTEFTSLLLLRFIEERARGLEPRAAMDQVSSHTGRAFVVSGLTAISGVAVISTSSLVLLRNFGLVVGMNVTVALVTALVVLPPLLVWADQRGWVSRHMITDATLRASTPKLREPSASAPATDATGATPA